MRRRSLTFRAAGRTARRLARPGFVALALCSARSPRRPTRASSPRPPTRARSRCRADGQLVWVVNPGADTVTVIRTSTQHGAQDDQGRRRARRASRSTPNNRYAFVANAAAGTVTVIRIRNASPSSASGPRSTGGVGRRGSSHDRRRAVEHRRLARRPARLRRQQRPGHDHRHRRRAKPQGRGQARQVAARGSSATCSCAGSACSRDPNFHFQPRGLAVTRNSKQLYVTSFLSFTRRAAGRATTPASRASSAGSTSRRSRRRSAHYRPRALIAIAPQVTGFTVDATGDGVADPTSAFPNQLQSIVIRGEPGLPAEHRRLAGRPAALQRSTRRRS